MQVHVTVEGDVSQMIARKRALSKQAFQEALVRVGGFILSLATELAPEDSGELKRSGRMQVVNDSVIITFGENLPDGRAFAQEFGTYYMPAQPYLSVAVKEIDIVGEIATAIRAVLI